MRLFVNEKRDSAKRGEKLLLFCCCFLLALSACGINEPVEEDYFNDIDRVKGREKPFPAPVIDDITATYDTEDNVYIIEIDFSSTQTIDPDTGTNEYLRYYLYYSFDDPAGFADEKDYYEETRLLGYIDESQFETSEKKIMLTAEVLNRRVYFWITAMDDGRESDHSNVDFIDI